VFEGSATGGEFRPTLAPVANALEASQDDLSGESAPNVLGERDPEALRMRRFSLLLSSLLAAQPVLLTLDDMHDADRDIWEWLRFALNARSSTRVLIVAAGRDDTRVKALRRELFYRLAGHVTRSVRSLRPLSSEDARRLVTLEAQLSDQAMDRVVELGRGNPLFLLELARLTMDEATERVSLALGPTYEAALSVRLASLRPEERRLLQAIAILDQPVPAGFALKAISGAGHSVLDRLVEAQLVVADESGTVALAHALLREPILETLSRARKRALAASLATAAVRTPAALGIYQIARLWEMAARPDEAQVAYRAAALHWENTLSLRDALPAYEALIRLSQPSEKAAYLVQMADAL
jgi:hypothetical protein